LTFRCLDFQPVFGAGAGQIFAVNALGHDAFEAFALRFLEKLRPERLAMTAKRKELMTRQDFLQTFFAFEQRELPQIFPIAKHKVEYAVEELCLMAEGVLQKLKM